MNEEKGLVVWRDNGNDLKVKNTAELGVDKTTERLGVADCSTLGLHTPVASQHVHLCVYSFSI